MLAGLFWKSQFLNISLWNIYFCYKSQFTFTTALMGECFFLPKNVSNFTVMIEARTLSHAFSQQKPKFDFACSTRFEFPSIRMYERTACAWLNRSLQIVYTDWMWMFSIIILYAVATIFDFIQIPRYTACWITALFLPAETLLVTYTTEGNCARLWMQLQHDTNVDDARNRTKGKHEYDRSWFMISKCLTSDHVVLMCPCFSILAMLKSIVEVFKAW